MLTQDWVAEVSNIYTSSNHATEYYANRIQIKLVNKLLESVSSKTQQKNTKNNSFDFPLLHGVRRRWTCLAAKAQTGTVLRKASNKANSTSLASLQAKHIFLLWHLILAAQRQSAACPCTNLEPPLPAIVNNVEDNAPHGEERDKNHHGKYFLGLHEFCTYDKNLQTSLGQKQQKTVFWLI